MTAVADHILTHIRELTRFDRVMCSEGYDRALDYVAAHLGCPDSWVSRESFPAGEEHWGWRVPRSMRHWRDGRPDPVIPIPGDRAMNLLHVRIPGTTTQEILFVTHLCHPAPSANDNASGAAMMIELVRHYARNPPPHFTLRFLFTVEYWGTVAFCARHEVELSRIVAGLSVDMVGANQDLCGSAMVVDEIPDHLASCFDLVLWHHLQAVSRTGRYRIFGNPVQAFRCDFQYYTGGSDHYILNDASVGIPATAIGSDPDRFNHTNDDTVDKIAPDTLHLFFSTIVNGVEAFSDPREPAHRHRAQLVLQRYDEVSNRVLLAAASGNVAAAEQVFRLTHARQHAAARLASMASSHPSAEPAPWLDILDERFEQVQAQFALCAGQAFEPRTAADAPRYRKTFKGPLFREALYARITPQERARIAGWLDDDNLLFHKIDAALNYSPRHGLADISRLLQMHYAGEPCEPRLAWVFDLLTRHGLVTRCDT